MTYFIERSTSPPGIFYLSMSQCVTYPETVVSTHNIFWIQQQLTLEKSKPFSTISCVPTEMFRNVLHNNPPISENKCINWIHHFRCDRHCGPVWPVFILKTNLTFFKEFCPFENIFLLKYTSTFTSHLLLQITYGLPVSATKILMTYLCSILEHCF